MKERFTCVGREMGILSKLPQIFTIKNDVGFGKNYIYCKLCTHRYEYDDTILRRILLASSKRKITREKVRKILQVRNLHSENTIVAGNLKISKRLKTTNKGSPRCQNLNKIMIALEKMAILTVIMTEEL